MAKKQTTLGVDFFTTTGKPEPTPADDIIQTKGVGLKRSEWEEIDRQAKTLHMTRHRVAAYLLRYGLQALREGKIKTKVEKQITFE